jgi:hypothetical protein
MTAKSIGRWVVRGLLPVIAICLLTSESLAQVRSWESASGNHKIEAELISADDQSVKLATVDGREMSIPLSKLSQEDRDYVAAQKTPAPVSEHAQIKQVAADFYQVIREDPERIREFLTTKGQGNFDNQRSYFKMGAADRGQGPRVTSIRFDKQHTRATANFRVKMGGDLQKMQMLLTQENGEWRVYGLVGLGKTSKITMNFDDAQSTTTPAS